MFTGIIEELGTVKSLNMSGNSEASILKPTRCWKRHRLETVLQLTESVLQ